MGRSVSLIVPSYKGAGRLPRLFDALEWQNLDRDWEVVLILDGTPDDSLAVAGGYSDRLPLVIVDLPENRGRPGALNAGFAAARCDVLLRCDDDLVPGPGFVEGHGRHHDGDQPVGVVGFCRNVFPDTAFSRVYGVDADRRHWAEALQRPAETRWLHWAGNCSVRREVWAKVGPYDPRYIGWGWEDIDWGYRLSKLAVPIVLDPELSADHYHAVTTCAARVDRAFSSGAAKRMFESIHGELEPAGPQTMWSRAVGMAALPFASWHHAVGRTLDATMGALPRGAGRRLVGFSVEAAAAGGYRKAVRAGVRS